MTSASKLPHRQALQRAVSALSLPFPSGTRYGGIYCDAPWRFRTYSTVTGQDRAAENHYATMSLDDIRALPVSEIAAKDSVLALWATSPMLPHALDVMSAWGFTYKSSLVWSKAPQIGLGYWFRAQHEILLLGTRGRPGAPIPGTQAPSVLTAPRGRHSAKPEEVATMLGRYFPKDKPRIEIFARRRRPGWDVWGAEVSDESLQSPAPTPADTREPGLFDCLQPKETLT